MGVGKPGAAARAQQESRRDPLSFKGAATTLITLQRQSPLGAHYDHLLASGTKPNLAKVTLARKIAAIVLAMWENAEVYDPTRHHVHK
jgi:hypothetical protein